MSVHRRGKKWQVKWREGDKQRSRTFDRKGDADIWDREVNRAKQFGPKLLRELTAPNVITLREFVKTGFRAYASERDVQTRRGYQWALKGHLVELLDEPLTEIDVPRVAEHQRRLLDNGRTPSTVVKVIKQLSAIMQAATEHGLIPANPVRSTRKVQLPPTEDVRPLAPVEVEAVIDAMHGRDRIVAVLAGHLGLRPKEVRCVIWRSLTDTTLTVRAIDTKRGAARTRVVAVPAATALELKRWRLQAGRPADDEPIIGATAESWIRNWNGYELKPVVKAINGRTDVSLYTLRHSHASALHYCGFTVPSAAARLGHDGGTHLDTYAHVINALEGKPHHADLDALIATARAELAARPLAASG